jgi:hypothetical protein
VYKEAQFGDRFQKAEQRERVARPPQARLEYYPGYYATWVLDPDGHDMEAVNKS